MTRALSIASVTVAYNSEQVLPRQLEALLRQSSRLEEVVVVDNASTDGTEKTLHEQYPQVTLLKLASNLGVGGGYAAGLAYAAKKHDWIWLLDADSVPRDDALEALLRELARLEDAREPVGMLASLASHSGTRTTYPGWLWRHGLVVPPPELWQQPVCFVDAVISSGSLVRRQVVEEAGLPRADFFIDFVDYEYCLRVRGRGYRIGVVRSSSLEHSLGSPRRIRFLGHFTSWTDHVPWREYYMGRNQTYTVWHDYPHWRSKHYVIRELFRHAVGIILFGKHKWACLRMMVLGFLDGRTGKLGIRFLPGPDE
jgi:rhamnosyltransferase